MNESSEKPAAPRWWPALVLVMAGTAAIGWVWLSGGEMTGQDRVFLTMPVLFGLLVLLAIWLVFLSRLSSRIRRRVLGIFLAIVAMGVATLRVRGVTGDLVPILEWRWANRADPAIETPAAPRSAAGTPASTTPAATAAASPAAPTTDVKATAAAVAPARLTLKGEYPQFLGADRIGVVRDIRLATNWDAKPPRLVWRRRVGAGWAGFAIADGIAVTQEQRGGKEMVVAYDLSDGSVKWAHGDDARYESTVAGTGPRATPTISQGRVYTLGSTGLLNSLDLKTGKRIWRHDIATENDAVQPDWGRSGSPLAVDDLVVVSAGGANGRSLVAYHRESGEPAWHGGNDLASYSSPMLATLDNVRQIVILNQASVAGHDPATGRILWEYPWPAQQPTVAQPVVLSDNRVLLSAGYGVGSKLLQLATSDGQLRPTLLWETPRLKAKFTNVVVHDGFVYGLDDGVLVCLDPADGERRWKSGRYGHGQVILAGELLLVQTEEGEIVLVEPRPDAHREIARFTVFNQKTWNPPALAGQYLLVRNDVEAALYELPMR
jgi:outer membrane protein assembly factor BamB